MRLNQVTVPARDIEQSVEFYTKLGLVQIVAAESYARFECPDGDSTFSVHAVEAVVPGGVTVYFECDDLDERVAALEAAGIAFESGPADMPWLWREARLRDPAGNEVCLFHAGENRRNPPWRLTDPGS